jgi:hypothetical protein
VVILQDIFSICVFAIFVILCQQAIFC